MDYSELSTILSFPACETQQCANVAIEDDGVSENVESFIVTLERSPSLDIRITLDPVDGMIEIRDDDGLFFTERTAWLTTRETEIMALIIPK